eukprot:COSAG01_NODE_4575_length_4911_cov_4.356608_2_plen_592_part_00
MEKEGSGGLPMLVALTLDGSILLCQVQPRCSCHLLAQLASGAAELGVSPSGEYLSFLVDGDLWVCALEGQGVQMHASTPTQLTHLGAPPISSVPLGTYYGVDAGIGRYVWGSDVPAYTWSPDSQFIAAHYVDRRAVRRTPFPYYLTEETTINWHRRSYPGDDLAGMSEVRGLYVIALPRSKEGSAQRLLQLHAPGVPREQASHLNGFAWRPVATTDLASLGMHLLIDVISDTGQARGLYICNVNRESLCDDAALCDRAKLVWSDFGHSRSYAAVGAGWLPDGNAWLVVDADERMQLGVLPLDASDGVHTVRMLTVAADGDVVGERGAAPVCASENGKLFYTRNAPNAECRPVYCVDGNGTAPPQLCTGQVGGCHVPFTSPDGAWLATVHSADTVPPRLSLFCVGKLSSHKTATTALTELPSCFTMGRLGRLCTPEYVHFPSEDGRYTLRGRLLRPVSGCAQFCAKVEKSSPVVTARGFADNVALRECWLCALSRAEATVVLWWAPCIPTQSDAVGVAGRCCCIGLFNVAGLFCKWMCVAQPATAGRSATNSLVMWVGATWTMWRRRHNFCVVYRLSPPIAWGCGAAVTVAP